MAQHVLKTVNSDHSLQAILADCLRLGGNGYALAAAFDRAVQKIVWQRIESESSLGGACAAGPAINY
jgi:hypothetical protein